MALYDVVHEAVHVTGAGAGAATPSLPLRPAPFGGRVSATARVAIKHNTCVVWWCAVYQCGPLRKHQSDFWEPNIFFPFFSLFPHRDIDHGSPSAGRGKSCNLSDWAEGGGGDFESTFVLLWSSQQDGADLRNLTGKLREKQQRAGPMGEFMSVKKWSKGRRKKVRSLGSGTRKGSIFPLSAWCAFRRRSGKLPLRVRACVEHPPWPTLLLHPPSFFETRAPLMDQSEFKSAASCQEREEGCSVSNHKAGAGCHPWWRGGVPNPLWCPEVPKGKEEQDAPHVPERTFWRRRENPPLTRASFTPMDSSPPPPTPSLDLTSF